MRHGALLPAEACRNVVQAVMMGPLLMAGLTDWNRAISADPSEAQTRVSELNVPTGMPSAAPCKASRLLIDARHGREHCHWGYAEGCMLLSRHLLHDMRAEAEASFCEHRVTGQPADARAGTLCIDQSGWRILVNHQWHSISGQRACL